MKELILRFFDLIRLPREDSSKPFPIENKPKRRWRLWQVESAISCNLQCIMCPWQEVRGRVAGSGEMQQETWKRLRPYLHEVGSIDFTGGGEPLLQKNLFRWLAEAQSAGCTTGFLTNGMLLNDNKLEQLLQVCPDWLGFSIDGADEKGYSRIRRGADFSTLCQNISRIVEKRRDDRPFLMINFVMMKKNIDQLEEIVLLCDKLGVDQLNFKNCDVIRKEHGKKLGVFAADDSRELRKIRKRIKKAFRLAKKMGISTTSFSLLPDERSVCLQDPRDSLFIRYDGVVAPCINLGYGGPTSFLGRATQQEDYHFGNLHDATLEEIWDGEAATSFRNHYHQRVEQHDRALANADMGRDLVKFKRALLLAKQAMGQPPPGCRVCHYLWDI